MKSNTFITVVVINSLKLFLGRNEERHSDDCNSGEGVDKKTRMFMKTGKALARVGFSRT